jgi:hypothetical protein
MSFSLSSTIFTLEYYGIDKESTIHVLHGFVKQGLSQINIEMAKSKMKKAKDKRGSNQTVSASGINFDVCSTRITAILFPYKHNM